MELQDEKLVEDIKRETNKKELPFWSILVVSVSLLHGLFILRFTGYLTEHSGTELGLMTEQFIGWGLIVFAIFKIIAMIGDYHLIKRLSVVALSFIWTGLFSLSLVYSFGIGHPNPYWYFYAVIVLGCYRISFKGGY